MDLNQLLTPHFKLSEIYCKGKHCQHHDRYDEQQVIHRMMPVLWALETIRAELNGRHETTTIKIVPNRGWSCDEWHEQIYKERGLPVNWGSWHSFHLSKASPCAVDFELLDSSEALSQKTLHEELYYDLRDTWPAGFHYYDWGFHVDTAEGGRRRWK